MGLQQLEMSAGKREVILSPGWDTIPWKEVSVSLPNGPCPPRRGRCLLTWVHLCLLIHPPRKGLLPDWLPPLSSVSLNWESPFRPIGQDPKPWATCVCVHIRFFATPRTPARVLCPWNSPGKNTGVGCHALLQGIFLTQGLNRGLLHCRWILYLLSHQGNPWTP